MIVRAARSLDELMRSLYAIESRGPSEGVTQHRRWLGLGLGFRLRLGLGSGLGLESGSGLRLGLRLGLGLGLGQGLGLGLGLEYQVLQQLGGVTVDK